MMHAKQAMSLAKSDGTWDRSKMEAWLEEKIRDAASNGDVRVNVTFAEMDEKFPPMSLAAKTMGLVLKEYGYQAIGDSNAYSQYGFWIDWSKA